MLRCKAVPLLLVILETATAYDVPSPFSWKAVENAERFASQKVASLSADSVRLQQRLAERVFASEARDTVPIAACQASASPPSEYRLAASTKALIALLLLTAPAAFCLGWACGTRQSIMQQAMQQARAEDLAEVNGSRQAEDTVAPAVTADNGAPLQAVPDSNSQLHAAGTTVSQADSLSSIDSDSNTHDHAINAQHQVSIKCSVMPLTKFCNAAVHHSRPQSAA